MNLLSRKVPWEGRLRPALEEYLGVPLFNRFKKRLSLTEVGQLYADQVSHELSTGELVLPCDLSLRSDKGYYLVYPESKQNSPLLQSFESWLLSTASRYIELNVSS